MASFRFLDDTTAQRELGIDRITFENYIQTGRLKVISRAGENIMFFRAADIAALRAELHPDEKSSGEEDLSEQTVEASPEEITAGTVAAPKRKRVDPAMRVHLRIQSDLKWYDVSDNDVLEWFKQLRPDGYERNAENFRYVIARYQRLLDLIQSGEERLKKEHGQRSAQREE